MHDGFGLVAIDRSDLSEFGSSSIVCLAVTAYLALIAESSFSPYTGQSAINVNV
jgi:hypothetical protein